MIGKLINFSTRYKMISNSGSYGDMIGLKDIGLNIITEGDDYDYLIFSLSNPVVAGGIMGEATKQGLLEIKKANKENKPILCLFLDFKIFPNKLNGSTTLRKKYLEFIAENEFEDNRDNWFLLSYTRDIEKFKVRVKNQKNGIKFKEDNIIYFNNMSMWYNGRLNINNNNNNGKICYIGNGRGGERNKFLSKFSGFDIYGRWKDKQIVELNHNFMGLVRQTEVQNTMNDYFGHIITYDKIGIEYKTDITRLVYTVAAGCLPLIDSRLRYLNLPEKFNELFIDNSGDIERILSIGNEKREQLINDLREFFNFEISKDDECSKIYSLINKYNENK